MLRSLLPISLIFSAACGSEVGKGSEDVVIDAAPRIDARARPDAARELPADCIPVSDLGDQGEISGTVVSGPNENYLSIDGIVDQGPPPDLLVVELFRGAAPFEDEIKTGEFEISGAQVDYNTCGTCVTVFADTDANEAPEMVYIAQAGQLSITSIDIYFTGSFTVEGEVVMKGQRKNDETGQWEDVPGCEIRAGNATWEKTIYPDIGP